MARTVRIFTRINLKNLSTQMNHVYTIKKLGLFESAEF